MIKIEYKQIISELCDKIQNNKLKHKNTVIMGDNSTGKTFLLESLNNSEDSILIKCNKNERNLLDKCFKQDIVLIDDIEIILSFNEILNINTLIKDKFDNKKLIITTHNLELISRLKNFNLINVSKCCYGIFDSNDFNTHNDVKDIINTENNNNDVILTTLLNLKLCNLWTKVEESRLSKLKKSNLTIPQSKLLEQILLL